MRKKQKVLNLFIEEPVSSIRHTFSIASEDDLDQCWDYFQRYHSESTNNLQEFIALFYEFSNHYITQHKNYFFELILEMNETHFFLTLRNKKVAQALYEQLKQKNIDYLFNTKRLSIRIDKCFKEDIRAQIDQERNQKIIESVSRTKKVHELIPPFTFISQEDLQDLLALSEDLEDIFMICKKTGFVEKLFIRFRSCFSLFSLTLRSYPQLSNVATTITNFSALINIHQKRFSELTLDEITLIEGFVYTIQRWLKALFVEGGVALTFMDNSLKADVTMIENIISPKEIEEINEEELDAIFDF